MRLMVLFSYRIVLMHGYELFETKKQRQAFYV